MLFLNLLLQSLFVSPYDRRSLPATPQKQYDLSYNVNANSIWNLMNKATQTNGMCKSSVIKLNVNIIKVIPRPKGPCDHCCDINIKRDISFRLYTKTKPQHGIRIPISKPGALGQAGFDKNSKTVIFVHGFLEPSPGPSGLTVRDAYLNRTEPYNIIILDWSELSALPWYVESAQNTRYVAKFLVSFLETYHDSGELLMRNVHLVGFSLGAQVCGFAGKMLRKDLRLRRITGLDPAYPLFPVDDPSKRLCKTDADFVDVIHTDGGLFGFPISIGHADFYPNGGRSYQPGCSISRLARSRKLDDILSCSHQRAWALYSESVRNPKAFPSTKCEYYKDPGKTCDFTADAYMGFGVDVNIARGNYHLATGSKSPFGKVAET